LTSDPTFLHIRSDEELGDLVAAISAADVVAFDTEFMWERTYRPVLALLQIAVPGFEAIVDPLAVSDLAPVWHAMADAPEVVVHAGEHDLDIMHDQIGRLPARTFDTQVAGGFVGLGETQAYGKLVDAVLGRSVRGGEGYTDWTQRPLSSAQIAYAIEDVRHLHELRAVLLEDLQQRGRVEWYEEEIELRLGQIGQPTDPASMWRRVKGSNRLSGKALNVLRSIAAWREEQASQRDVSRRRLVPDQVLIEIARRAPTDPNKIASLRGLHQGQAKKIAGPLADRVREAATVPESDWPRWPRRRPHADHPAVEPAASVLHGVLRMKARALDLAPGLIANRSDLEEIVRRRIAEEPDVAPPAILDGWRRSVIGDDLLHLLDGDVRLRLSLDGSGPAIEIA
jgi:ribonuclease D